MTNENDAKASEDKIIDLDPDQVIDVDAPPKSPPSPAKPPRRRASLPLLGLGAVLLGALGGGWLYRDVLSTYLPSDEMARVIAKADAMEAGNTGLREQLGNLDKLSAQFKTDIDALETTLNSTQSDAKAAGDVARGISGRVDDVDKALSDLRAAQSSLTDSIAKLQATPPAAVGGTQQPIDLSALTQRLDALEKDVASLKASPVAGGADTAALSQALSDLKAKFASGATFADELARVQRMAPAAPGLDDLSRHAATGLPNVPALAVSLKSIAAELKPSSESAVAAEDDSWIGWATGMLNDIVTIRNAGDADWVKTAEAAAAFAETGDLAQAISHVSEAEGAKPPALQQWLEKAQARVALEASISGVEAAVLRMLAAKG